MCESEAIGSNDRKASEGGAIGWLLKASNPAIRYRTMTRLVGLSESAREVDQCYQAIWQLREVRRMLGRQTHEGIWQHSSSEYGSHTSLRYLTAFAELGLHRDERLDRQVEYTVQFFAEKETADLASDYTGCSNALVLRALVMLGYNTHPRVYELLQRYAASQLSDGGFICRRLIYQKPTRKGCYKAAVAALLLYAECKLRGELLPGTEQLLVYFLKRDVFFDSQDKKRLLLDGRPGWRSIDNFFPAESMRMGLPLIVAALAVLGVGTDPAMERAWEMLTAKRNQDGRYTLEGTLSKQPCSFGKVGEENLWVTFYALLAERHRGGI